MAGSEETAAAEASIEGGDVTKFKALVSNNYARTAAGAARFLGCRFRADPNIHVHQAWWGFREVW